MVTDITCFYQYKQQSIPIQQVSGNSAQALGYGLVLVRIPNTSTIIPLWPTYYMPSNPQNTLSPTAIKHYNKYRSVTIEALGWIKLTDRNGVSHKLWTNSTGKSTKT